MVAGNIADLGFAIQTTKGTPSAASIERSYLMGGGLAPNRAVADVEESSSGRLRNTTFVQSVSAVGDPQMAMRPNMIGLLLYAAMGAKAVSGAADPWTHTFTLAASQPYLTIWRMLGAALFERFVDCKVTGLTIESAHDNVVTVTATIAGLTPAFQTAAESAVAAEATEPFLHTDAKALLKVETVVISAIRRVTMTITTGSEIVYGDSVTGDQVADQQLGITIETEQTILDMAEWNRFHYGSTSPANNAPAIPGVIELAASGLDMTWSKRDTTGAAATPARSLQVTATRVQIGNIAGMDVNASGAPLTRVVTYRIVQPVGGGSGLTAILKNGRSTYTPN